MIKWSFALTWQQPTCTQLASKYFIFNNILWMGSRSTLSETTHKHVRTALPPGSVTVPPEYDLRACSLSDIRPFLLMKVSPQQTGRYKTVFSAFCLSGFAHFHLFLKCAQQPSHNLSTHHPETMFIVMLWADSLEDVKISDRRPNMAVIEFGFGGHAYYWELC